MAEEILLTASPPVFAPQMFSQDWGGAQLLPFVLLTNICRALCSGVSPLLSIGVGVFNYESDVVTDLQVATENNPRIGKHD